jgi:hypothetical protein
MPNTQLLNTKVLEQKVNEKYERLQNFKIFTKFYCISYTNIQMVPKLALIFETLPKHVDSNEIL